MREIVLDTETTGLDPGVGHRVVEIACLELVNHIPTGESFQCYINPERDMPAEAFAIHGLSREFLADHPVFTEIADGFLAFIAADPLIIHNAGFDLRFLNAELARIERAALPTSRAVDTVEIARRKFPGAQANLDALCKRFGVDLSEREKHGALVDVKLLARVYLELIGGSQPGLELAAEPPAGESGSAGPADGVGTASGGARAARTFEPEPAELAAHEALVDQLSDPIWRRQS